MSTNINIRVDNDVKDQAEKICVELGINRSTAINRFLRAVIRDQGIPFELKLDIPNEKTAAAIKEGDKRLKDPSAPQYSSIEELKTALGL